jgi:hypothetical protein
MLAADLLTAGPQVASLAAPDLEAWSQQGDHLPLWFALHHDQLHFLGYRPYLVKTKATGSVANRIGGGSAYLPSMDGRNE